MVTDPLAIQIPIFDGTRPLPPAPPHANGDTARRPAAAAAGTPSHDSQLRGDAGNARGFNLLIWKGRLASDPEIKTAPSGTRFLRVRCLQDQSDRNGQAGTQGVEIALFNERAESFVARFRKGDQVLVKGRLTLETHRDKDGVLRATASIHPEGAIDLLHRPQR